MRKIMVVWLSIIILMMGLVNGNALGSENDGNYPVEYNGTIEGSSPSIIPFSMASDTKIFPVDAYAKSAVITVSSDKDVDVGTMMGIVPPVNCEYKSDAMISSRKNDTISGWMGGSPPVVGDWIISAEIYGANETAILNGNITIESGGKLTLKNVTLKMNVTFNGQYNIEVKRGGALFIQDNDNSSITQNDRSKIESCNPNYHYTFKVLSEANFKIIHSIVCDVGYSAGGGQYPAYGLYVEANSTYISHACITNGFLGLILWKSQNSCIEYSNISHHAYRAIQFFDADWNIVCNTSIYQPPTPNYADGIEFASDSSNNTLSDNVINTTGNGIFFYLSDAGNDNELVANKVYSGRYALFTNGQRHIIMNNVFDGFFGSQFTKGGCTLTVKSNIFISRGTGSSAIYTIRLFEDTELFENCTLNAINGSSVALHGTNPSHAIFLNTTFVDHPMTFVSGSTLTVKNYLHIEVIDCFGIPISNALVSIRDNGVELYNGTTNNDGKCCWMVVTDRIYYNEMPTEIVTAATVWYGDFIFNNNSRDINMSTSHTETFQQLGPPGIPIALSATPNNGQVTLSWSVPISDGGSLIISYNVYRGTIKGGPKSKIWSTSNGSTTTYTDTGLTNGVTYYYCVSAVNVLGEGSNSSEMSVTPKTVPGAPTGLVAMPGNEQITLTWSAPSSDGGSVITNYRIYRGTTSSGASYLVTTGNVLTYNDTIVTNDVIYYYKISAVNGIGESLLSNEAYATPTLLAGNHVPIVNSITANPVTISAGVTVTITVSATDEDVGDVLTYVYSCTGGTISGTGNTVTWIAPDTAETYTVSVYVNDGTADSNSKSVTITVTDGDEGDTTDGGEEDVGEDKKQEKGFIPSFELIYLISALCLVLAFKRRKRK